MTRLIAIVLMLTVGSSGLMAAGVARRSLRGAATGDSTQDLDVLRKYLAAVPPGSLVSIRLRDGTRVKGTLLVVESDVVHVKPRGRVPQPERPVPIAAIESLDIERGGIGVGKAVAIGIGSAVATFVSMWLIAFALLSD